MIEYIVLIALSLAWFYLVDWVYQARTKVLNEDFEHYLNLPAYLSMVLQFWIWDVNRFKVKP